MYVNAITCRAVMSRCRSLSLPSALVSRAPSGYAGCVVMETEPSWHGMALLPELFAVTQTFTTNAAICLGYCGVPHIGYPVLATPPADVRLLVAKKREKQAAYSNSERLHGVCPRLRR